MMWSALPLLASMSLLLACLLFPFVLRPQFLSSLQKSILQDVHTSGQFYSTASHGSLLVLLSMASFMLTKRSTYE